MDGFTQTFTLRSLYGTDILVVANALDPENETEWVLPTPSAFSGEEVAAVRDWVAQGGSLLLIADHMPFPGAAEQLASAFGVYMCNGFAMTNGTDEGKMVFSKRAGTLPDHPITRGRSAAEAIDSVVSFTGQAFRVSAGGEPLMILGNDTRVLMPPVAWQFSRLTPSFPGDGMLQGAAVRVGRGRVAVFGEAAMFSAQVAGPGRAPMGVNDPSAPQNAQFLLNIIHWLSGVL